MTIVPDLVFKTIDMSEYIPPRCRAIFFYPDKDFLQSNTEPIGGGNDPDIEW